MNIREILIVYVMPVTFLLAGFLLIIVNTKNKTRFGINTKDMFCPKCQSALPKLRSSANLHQMLWGGWTCSVCQCEVDKWGRERGK